jgi:uncharacterized protein
MSSALEVYRSPQNDQWYFRITARNGEIVAQSEGYTRKEDAIRGAKDARRAARFASVRVIS